MIDLVTFSLIKENKILLACLAKTLGVFLKRDLSESIILKYLYSFTCSIEGNHIQKIGS